METLAHPSATEFDLSAVLHALSDPVRRSIVRRLAREGEVPCVRLALIGRIDETALPGLAPEGGVVTPMVDGGPALGTRIRTSDTAPW